MPAQKLRTDLPIVLNNETCPYCGGQLVKEGLQKTKEHVIGRRFVPRGTLDKAWNLILFACIGCNGKKADLENDISAISMQPEITGNFATNDPEFIAESIRKGKRSISRLTGKTVNTSASGLDLKLPYGNAVLTVNLACAPQVDYRRAYELARLQLMGFFYWLTYNEETRKGGFWRGDFSPLFHTVRSDWGNVIMRGFMDAVVGWEPRLIARGANGFFLVAIRRHPNAECWSWAVEWNKNHRVIGFFGNRATAEEVVGSMPKLMQNSIFESRNSWVRYHIEKALPDNEDKLFYYDYTSAPAEASTPPARNASAISE